MVRDIALSASGLLNPQVGGPLAPGTIIAVYGSNLAAQTGQPTTLPLATSFNGTSVIIGGIPENDYTRVIRQDPNRKEILYSGTETGVYISFDDGEQ